MPTTLEALRKMGVRINEEELERLLVKAVAGAVSPLPAGSTPTPAEELTEAELAALERGGFKVRLRKRTYGAKDPIVQAAAEYAALVETGLTVDEAAEILAVDASRIRQRLAARTLYGVKESGRWRLPRFQFARGRPLPGLDVVLPHLDPELDPVSVYRWFTTPNVDLVIDEQETVRLSPRDWLLSGRDPQPVAELAVAL